jgi:branched-chain amino acid transport system substrate-binding protein
MISFTKFKVAVLVGATASTMVLTGCSSGGSGGSGSGGGLPDTITLQSINDLTGPAGVAGQEIKKGYDLALKKINGSDLLGGSTLKIEYKDSAGVPGTGAQLASQAVTGKFPIVFGSPVGGVALAEASILARAKQPTIFNEAASPGVIANDWIYRMTPVIADYYGTTLEYLKSQNIKTLSVLTNTDQPSLLEVADHAVKEADKYGYKVISTDKVISTQPDVSAIASKIAARKPEAVAAVVQTGQNASVVKALREAGYEGLITSTTSAGGGILGSAGKAADGVVWSANYAWQQEGAANEEFVKDFTAAYKTKPTNWAATAYDAMFFAAESLKKAGSIDKAAVHKAMKSIGDTGFDGVRGRITVEKNQISPSAVMVEWRDGKQEVLDN